DEDVGVGQVDDMPAVRLVLDVGLDVADAGDLAGVGINGGGRRRGWKGRGRRDEQLGDRVDDVVESFEEHERAAERKDQVEREKAAGDGAEKERTEALEQAHVDLTAAIDAVEFVCEQA